MTAEIEALEMAWLKAEAQADEARTEARAADAALSRISDTVNSEHAPDLGMLKAHADQAKVRHASAEASACGAFDRMWSAKSGAQKRASSAAA